MKNSVLARRYAKALFMVGMEENAVDQFASGLNELAQVFVETPEVRDALCNPMYPLEVRAKVMAYLAEQLAASQVLTNFLNLLVQKKRAAVLPQIAEAFQDMVHADRNVCMGTVITATGMDEALVDEVKATLERITGKTVMLTAQVDPSILGGIVAKVGDLVLDGSLKTQLTDLKESITGRQ